MTKKYFVNDVHSQLNKTEVRQILYPTRETELVEYLKSAIAHNQKVAVCGGRGAMGGQQFAHKGILIDLSRFNRVLKFSKDSIVVEAGMDWPKLHRALKDLQKDVAHPKSFRQKQTGADFLSIGGSVSANVHGRGLFFPPFVSDVLSFKLLKADASIVKCSRKENKELFALAIGGYGCFGIILEVELQLHNRTKLRRHVEIVELDRLPDLAKDRIEKGFEYGDFQFSTDEKSQDFMRRGVCATYMPVGNETTMPEESKELSEKDWAKLYELAHVDRERLYKMYTEFYMNTSGQLYWSDTHQMSVYLKDYHMQVDRVRKSAVKGSEMITEIYVSHQAFPEFFEAVRADFISDKTELIYGTVRLIKKDTESFLPWAKEDWACTIFNLHVDHSPEGIQLAQMRFKKLIDRGLEFGGSYYLTYHRWATKEQLLKAYPKFPEFLKKKIKFDPQELFYSDWYAHHKDLLA